MTSWLSLAHWLFLQINLLLKALPIETCFSKTHLMVLSLSLSLFSASTVDTCRRIQNPQRRTTTNRKRSAESPWQPRTNEGLAWTGLPASSLTNPSDLSCSVSQINTMRVWLFKFFFLFTLVFLMLTTLPLKFFW